ncbi:hypothetical protein [Beijerinckia sp. L45]|uniref:hypothetical protein n=1 Tax=Beijerinckia sp. L45 TaxID=1641855 RepID=UPI00131C41D7|nr:hypothetical protein [Beijerinckia sp. L45]
MAPELDDRKICALVVRFRAAAMRWRLCNELYLGDDKDKARSTFEATVQELDSFTSEGRAALIPLLKDDDKGV